MSQVRLLSGKPLMVGGKVALTDDCCCGSGNTGACCPNDDTDCIITTEEECLGNYLGNGTTCDDVDCTEGACCYDDALCTVTTEDDCVNNLGGFYFGNGSTCEGRECGGDDCNCMVSVSIVSTFTSTSTGGTSGDEACEFDVEIQESHTFGVEDCTGGFIEPYNVDVPCEAGGCTGTVTPPDPPNTYRGSRAGPGAFLTLECNVGEFTLEIGWSYICKICDPDCSCVAGGCGSDCGSLETFNILSSGTYEIDDHCENSFTGAQTDVHTVVTY